MKMELLFGFLAVSVLCFAGTAKSLESDTQWTGNQLIESSKFSLKWVGSDAEWLTMEMSAPAKGYVSVGFSPTGSMKDSDFVMGWVDKDGKAYLKDLYGVGNTKPKEDPSQNVELISGAENEKGTTIRFRRKWTTGDKEHDMEIGSNEVIVLWAFNEQDPAVADEDGVFRPPYHFTNRGAKKLFLRSPAEDKAAFRAEERISAEASSLKPWTKTEMIESSKFSFKWLDQDPEWLTMEISAPAKGYVSVGFSPTGSMKDSDFVMGWVDANGKAYLKDLYGVGNTKPKEDPIQNAELISGHEDASGTTIRFRRRWNTNDSENDMQLEAKPVIVLWAFNDQDPAVADEDGVFRPPYHFTNRGAKTFQLRASDSSAQYRIEEAGKTQVLWTHHQFVESSKFAFKWAGQDPEWLTMEISAPAKGYVSVGFSPTGSMKDSDFVMGWVDDSGKVHIKDLYGVGNTKPKEDTVQDVELLSGHENENGTTIRFRRKWNTGDKEQDMALVSDPVIVLWAFNDKDPAVADDDGVFRPPYHFTNRGAQNYHLRSNSTMTTSPASAMMQTTMKA